MKICISGLSGSGKTTIAKMLSRRLNFPLIATSYKKFTSNIVDFTQKNIYNKKLAKKFDEEIVKLAKKEKNCIVSTWLAPWLIKDSIKVWLNASEKERIKRVAKREKISIKKATQYVKKKDSSTIKHFKEVYGINILEHENFDLIINTEKFSKKKIVEIIASSVSKNKK
ncbi:MAG: (d)CMP kinase [Candidatus Micrarchaeia archaeon]